MTSNSQSLFRGLTLSACTLAVLATVHAEQAIDIAPAQMDTLVVSATRTPQDPKSIPNSVSLLSVGDLAESQVVDLRMALLQAPGVSIVSTGAAGSQSSVFIRGANSHQTLLVVDGIPMNDRSNSYLNFFGGAELAGLDRMEVLRGPQGTLYGSSAMGGVVLMDTAHGCGKATGVVGFGAGSNAEVSGKAAVAGGTRVLGYSASISHLETDNDRPGNNFNQWSYSGRLEAAPTDAVLVGATFRAQVGDYEEAGSIRYNSPGHVDNQNHLGTAYLRLQPVKEFSSRLTTGLHHRDYIYSTAYGASKNQSVRRVADWQNTWDLHESVELVGGAMVQQANDRIDSYGVISRYSDRLNAAYLSATAKPLQELVLNAGIRHDNYRSWGDATTWRSGAAWLVKETGTTLRSTYGTAFTAPSTTDVVGVEPWGQLANPNILPERSSGWDAGILQDLFKGAVTLELTYFQNKYKNLIEWQTTDFTTFKGMQVNRARATTRGVESAISFRHSSGLSSRLSYTYLDASDDSSNKRLTRRPHHVADGEVKYNFNKKFVLGAGAHVVASRLDSGLPVEDYTTARVFASYDLSASLTLKARVENVLDEKYQEAYGYPGLPATYHAAVEWRF